MSLAIFDSRQPPGTGQGVYASGRAEMVEDDESVEAYSKASERWADGAVPRADVTGDAEFRLYRVTADEVWVLDSANDPRRDRGRTPVAL